MHPDMIFRAAEIEHRQRLEESTLRRERLRFVSTRVTARTRNHEPSRRSA
ncbi:hypothetical protein CLV34_0352 [Luteimicrobium subarcticum]|uniref:Uncharacterized protein n=1 Tax=Luteimicrobium subarcticum TaxID=620910 RepID=A0A2M8WUA3_9MICO|nr:hypothetical protein CLV34_0352 [Luteimicrobium subarcticum]